MSDSIGFFCKTCDDRLQVYTLVVVPNFRPQRSNCSDLSRAEEHSLIYNQSGQVDSKCSIFRCMWSTFTTHQANNQLYMSLYHWSRQ